MDKYGVLNAVDEEHGMCRALIYLTAERSASCSWLLGLCGITTKRVDGDDEQVDVQRRVNAYEEKPSTFCIAPAGREEQRYWKVLRALLAATTA